MDKPTVGRIVRYRVSPDEHERATGYEPGGDSIIEWPAIVTAVHNDTCVNLRVFSDGPKDLHLTSKTLGEEVGEWHWPPRS